MIAGVTKIEKIEEVFLKYLRMLLGSADLDSRVDEVVVLKTVCVVAESGGVPQVTLKFPPRPPKINTFIFYLLNCALLYLFAQHKHLNMWQGCEINYFINHFITDPSWPVIIIF